MDFEIEFEYLCMKKLLYAMERTTKRIKIMSNFNEKESDKGIGYPLRYCYQPRQEQNTQRKKLNWAEAMLEMKNGKSVWCTSEEKLFELIDMP